MRFFWSSAIKDLRLRLADPMALLLWLGIPLLIGGLMGLVASGQGGAGPKAKLLLVDEDQSFLSQFLAGVARQGDLGEFLEVETVQAEAGRLRMDAGEASAMLVLPKGFGEAILMEQETELTLITNPSQRIMPKIIEEGLEIVVEVVFYLQRLLGEPIRGLVKDLDEGQNFLPDARVAGLSAEINKRMRSLEGTLFPPVLTLVNEAKAKKSGEQGFNFGRLMFPGILFMALLFIAQGMSDDLWHEKNQGTLRRVVSAPQGLASFLLGKLMAGCLLMTAVS